MSNSTLTAHPADTGELGAALVRLNRLEGFLLQDPDNQTLLIDAFETALACSDWERAKLHLQHGMASQANALPWALREGDYWLAQKDYALAQVVLETLLGTANAPSEFLQVVVHNLAYIDFRQENYRACVARLAPTMEGGVDAAALASPVQTALQQLWLRSLHHVGDLERACSWTLAAEKDQRLDWRAAGIGSLIAMDAANLELAQRWSAWALAQGGPDDRQMEALVTQSSLALGARDAKRAKQLANDALQINPNAGRAWSARAFADLLAGAFADANVSFARALQTMPSHIGTWHGQGWLQVLQKNLDAAQATFETALEMDRNFAESHGGLAVVLALKGQTELAKKHIELAIRLDSSNLSGRYAQAILSGEARDAASLQRIAKRLLGGRAAPLGGKMSDFIDNPEDPS